MSDSESNPVQSCRARYSVDEIVQRLRTLKLSQIRLQLEDDERNNVDRFYAVSHFVTAAHEKQ